MRSNEEIRLLIGQLREKANMSVGELSRRTGLAKSTVSRYLNGSRPIPLDRLDLFAKALHVESNYLLDVNFPIPSNIVPIDRVVEIPVLGTIAAGKPILAEQNYEDKLVMLERNVPSGEVIALNIKGDSMTPGILDGSQVLIRVQPEVEDGEIAAVLLNDQTEATLKRVKRQNGVMLLIADNAAYDPIVVTEESPAYIIGKAVKVLYDL